MSLLPLSDLERTQRIDAAYYSCAQRANAERLAIYPNATVAEVTHVSDGNHFTISHDFVEEGGVPYYRGQDVVGHFFAEHSAPIGITQRAFEDRHMRRSHLKKDDVLLSIVGSIGQLSLVGSDRDATCSCKLAILRPHGIDAAYLAAFLKARPARLQIERLTRGAVQLGLLLEDMDQLRVARCRDLEIAVASAVRQARCFGDDAAASMQNASDHLTRALALPSQGTTPLAYTRSASETASAGRLDATYFSPAKQAILDALAALPHVRLGARFRSVRNMFDPSTPGQITEVRDYDLPDALQPVLDEAKAPEPVSAIGSLKKHLARDDVVVSRLRAYLKEVAVVRAPDGVPVVGSSEFIVLRPQEGEPALSPESLLAFLRSDPVQNVLRYCQDGSQHPRFREADLLAIPLPHVLTEVDAEITRAVQAAFAARRRARLLLDTAVHAIEIAIEESESAAVELLQNEIGLITRTGA